MNVEEIADIYPGKPFPVIGYITRDGDQQIFCPFCGCRHHHGGDKEEVNGYYGPVIGCRVPHCGIHPVAKRGYDIVETHPHTMPKVLADIARANERRRRNTSHKNDKEYQPQWLAGWTAGWAPGTAPGPDWIPHSYNWCDIDEKWKNKPAKSRKKRRPARVKEAPAMITTDDPSGNGIVAFGLFDLCGAMDLMPRLYADMEYVQIAGKTKYKTFNPARNHAWHTHGEPLFMRLYEDKITGKWNYHVIFPFYTSDRHRDDPGAVVMNLEQVTAIVEGGRKYLDYLFAGGHIE